MDAQTRNFKEGVSFSTFRSLKDGIAVGEVQVNIADARALQASGKMPELSALFKGLTQSISPEWALVASLFDAELSRDPAVVIPALAENKEMVRGAIGDMWIDFTLRLVSNAPETSQNGFFWLAF